MMQRVTNMEMLKLSYWNPAKDMKSILVDIKHFLQQWARIEATSERNDRRRYPYGSYVDIEHHLLRLALVRTSFDLWDVFHCCSSSDCPNVQDMLLSHRAEIEC